MADLERDMSEPCCGQGSPVVAVLSGRSLDGPREGVSFIRKRGLRPVNTIASGSTRACARGLILQFFCCVSLLFALAGCQVQLVSGYDETTDTLTKNLQSKIDTQFQSWIRMPAGSPGLRYDDKSNRDFYAGVSADLSVLESRAKAQPLNQTTVSMIEIIRNSIDKIEDFHKANQTISPLVLRSAQEQIDFQLQRLVAFELAKKRGETPKS